MPCFYTLLVFINFKSDTIHLFWGEQEDYILVTKLPMKFRSVSREYYSTSGNVYIK